MNMGTRKHQSEEVVRLKQLYAGVNVSALTDDELDEQIVAIGRHCHYNNTHGLDELLDSRKQERWWRKSKQPVGAVNQIEAVNQELRSLVADVYQDTLDTAQSLKRDLDAAGRPYRKVLQAQLYVERFDDELNRFADEDNDQPGLLDVLMDMEALIASDFLNITFEIASGKDIQCPTLDELFTPTVRDAVWNALLTGELRHHPAASLCYPLRALYVCHNVALQDILAIRSFGFATELWNASMG